MTEVQMSDPGRDRDTDDEPISFRKETEPARSAMGAPWRILSVDDDDAFQNALAHALKNVEILGRRIDVIRAGSMSQAARLLAKDRSFAVILADVVMETEDAGLRLAKGVREMLGLYEPRIILLTGQPGFAPIEDVMENYDLSDYCLKSDLARRGIKNVLTAAIRSYEQLTTISAARKGLQLILEASNRFTAARSIGEIASAALTEVAGLLGVPPEGIVCVEGLEPRDCNEPVVVGGAGRFAPYVRLPLADLPDPDIAALIEEALKHRHSLDHDDYQVMYFPRQHAMAEYAIYLATGQRIDDAGRELLQVFSANASKGFGNVALISRLDRMAYEDELLRIPNRSALLREIERLRLKRDSASGYQLVLIDLDNFGGLNDAFGVALGNDILRALIEPLRLMFQPPAMVARVAADLFAVLGPVESVDMHCAQQIFDEPIQVSGGPSLRLTACTVQTRIDAVEGDSAELLRAAWCTLRSVKRLGPGHSAEYDPQIEKRAGDRFAMMSRLAHAIEGDALLLHFQPQVDLATRQIVGVEALLRWQDESNLVPPGEFIPIAEQSSYILPIGELVVRKATQALARLRAAGFDQLDMSLNVSARQFEDPELIEKILAMTDAAALPREHVVLEVTETSAMGNFAIVSKALQVARNAGLCVAIDDFGTGFSSLAYVHELPANHLKIDRAFVSRLEDDARSRQIAHTIIRLGKTLGATLIAEGVETEAQAAWLREHGCHFAQGWLFGRPMPLDALIEQHGTAASI
jgi:diguanylate cyclase (GGDEF)-like protein